MSRLLVSLGFIFLAGLAFDAVGRRTRLPRVTLLMLFGFAVGPAGLDVLPEITASWFPMVADIALVMIGFLLGGQLTRSALKEHGRQVLNVSLAVVAVTFGAVTAGLVAIGAPLEVALLLGAAATATAPAATADVVHESRRDTSFSRTLLAVIAVDDVWGIIVFSLALAAGLVLHGDGAGGAFLTASWEIGGAIGVGVAIGVPMAYLTGRIEPGEPSLYEALGIVFLCGGLALWLEVSFLLASVALGATVANLASHHTRPFHAIEGIEWPFMLLFFVLAGASLDIGVLAHAGTWLTAYVALRIVGRVLGAWLGGTLPPADAALRRWMGIALLPQAGVALGMALVASRRFPEVGGAILPVVVAATVIFEVLGPLSTRYALERTSSGH